MCFCFPSLGLLYSIFSHIGRTKCAKYRLPIRKGGVIALMLNIQVVLTGPVINMCGSEVLLMTVRPKAWARQLAVSTKLPNFVQGENIRLQLPAVKSTTGSNKSPNVFSQSPLVKGYCGAVETHAFVRPVLIYAVSPWRCTFSQLRYDGWHQTCVTKGVENGWFSNRELV